jgi:hypothetical protein
MPWSTKRNIEVRREFWRRDFNSMKDGTLIRLRPAHTIRKLMKLAGTFVVLVYGSRREFALAQSR